MNNDKIKKIIVDIVCNIATSFKFTVSDMSIFPGYNLIPIFKLSLVLSAIDVVCKIADIPTFIGYLGAILNSVFLGVLCLLHRGEDKI